MDVQVRYYLGGVASIWSVPITFLCANVPNAPAAPSVTLGTMDLIIVEWGPPASDGGTPILGYDLYMKSNAESAYTLVYDGSQNPTTKSFMITSYEAAAL
jgi:hypothetical protein